MSKSKSRKTLYIRFFDNPMDDVVQEWLESIPKYQYGGLGGAVKKALFEYAQQMGFRLPEPEPEPKKVIKVISARRQAQRKALEAQQEAEEKAEMEAFIKEKTKIDLSVEDDSDFLKKMAQSLEDTF
ncbi:MAG: hypothetical protein H0S81_02865 [Desulfotignum balticum]|jgi:hypothetical protein|uniref:Uncharacterized protein n=1 Tax=Desulfotignum balticum TaxID=115781 RepID=A0A931CSW1_9BACT|nr:hypothetical protein [Desulfotignum balticum]